MFKLMQLPYSFDALEPQLDAQTVETHYSKHHSGYVNKLNELLANFPEFLELGSQENGLEKLLQNIDKLPSEIQTAVFNNAGQVYNHNLYWQTLTSNGSNLPNGELKTKIEEKFGSFENFKKEFSALGMAQFGSGWVWLCLDLEGKLEIIKTSNADSPLTQGKKPLMVMDIWEHAYYLKYKNLRASYIESFWNLVNWQEIETKYLKIKQEK